MSISFFLTGFSHLPIETYLNVALGRCSMSTKRIVYWFQCSGRSAPGINNLQVLPESLKIQSPHCNVYIHTTFKALHTFSRRKYHLSNYKSIYELLTNINSDFAFHMVTLKLVFGGKCQEALCLYGTLPSTLWYLWQKWRKTLRIANQIHPSKQSSAK